MSLSLSVAVETWSRLKDDSRSSRKTTIWRRWDGMRIVRSSVDDLFSPRLLFHLLHLIPQQERYTLLSAHIRTTRRALFSKTKRRFLKTTTRGEFEFIFRKKISFLLFHSLARSLSPLLLFFLDHQNVLFGVDGYQFVRLVGTQFLLKMLKRFFFFLRIFRSLAPSVCAWERVGKVSIDDPEICFFIPSTVCSRSDDRLPCGFEGWQGRQRASLWVDKYSKVPPERRRKVFERGSRRNRNVKLDRWSSHSLNSRWPFFSFFMMMKSRFVKVSISHEHTSLCCPWIR